MSRHTACAVAVAALLLALDGPPSRAQTQGAAAVPLLIDGAVELDIWSPDTPTRRQKHACMVAGTSLDCPLQYEVGPSAVSGLMKGTIRGSKIAGDTIVTIVYRNADCPYTYESRTAFSIDLSPDGTLASRLTGGVAKLLSASGPCAANLPRTTASPDATLIGTWRQSTAGAGSAVAVGQGVPQDGNRSVRLDGDRIYVTDETGKTRVLTVLLPKKVEMPVFTPPSVSGEAKAIERYVVTRLFEASYAHLPSDQQAAFATGLPTPSDLAGEAAQATLNAGESAVNWVKNNPADASLLGLSVAVSIAFPISAFANPTVAVGGAAVLRGVVGGAMVAGTTGFVSTLAGSFISDKSAMQRIREATAKGVGDASASVPGSLAGAAFEAAVGQGLAKAAVTAGSVVVGVAVDKAVEKAQVSQSIADAALKAPSFAGSLIRPPDGPSEPGGISLNFDR
jgi:hypothetical protein